MRKDKDSTPATDAKPESLSPKALDGELLAAPRAFDYKNLPGALRQDVAEHARAIQRLHVQMAVNIVQIGKRLELVHSVLGRGRYQAWLAAEFDWSVSLASSYEQVARVFGNIDSLNQFQPSALVALARHSASDAARAEALDRARKGELITKSTAELIIFRNAEHEKRPRKKSINVERICDEL